MLLGGAPLCLYPGRVSDALFPPPARVVGEVEQALLGDLQAWADSGHQVPAAVVAGLRRMAQNCDLAKPGQGLAQATDRYLEQLRQWQPADAVHDDAWAAFLSHASQPTISDAT